MPDEDFEKHRIKWEFFKLHASQRLTLFWFYIGLATSLFIAYFYLLARLDDCHGTHFLYICLMFSGAGIIAISFLFRALDSRNVELIDNAKQELNEVAHLSKNNPNTFRHKQIFNVVFSTMSVVGMLLLGLGGYKYGYCSFMMKHPVAVASSPHIDNSECNCLHK